MTKFARFVSLSLISAMIATSVTPAFAGRTANRTGKGTAVIGGQVSGNKWGRGHTVQKTESGSTVAASGGAFETAKGAKGARGSTTTINPDGSASRQGGLSGSGARGSIASQGQATRNADGTYSGQRSTQATNAATGNSYDGNTTYNSTDGVKRTATCTDAGGNSINCPRQASGNQNPQ